MDKSAKFWDRQATEFGEHEHDIHLDENKDFVSTLKYLNSSDVVLDYGCGAGVVARGIADKVKEIQAIDISSEVIEVARGKAIERGIENIDYAQGTIFDERFDKESFDVVLAFRVLHVLEDPRAAIRRAGELLKPGGRLISVSACMGDWNGALRMLMFLLTRLRIVPRSISVFSLSELEAMMTGESLEIVECEKMDDRQPHYYIVARKP